MVAKPIGERGRKKGGLGAKDLVFIAVFGILIFLVFLAFSMIFSINPHISWFTHTVGAIPAGIVWVYIVYRVPKRWAIAIMGAIIALAGFLMGMFWSGPVGILVGGILADFVLGDSEKRRTSRVVASFAVFTFCFWFGQIFLIIIGGQSYVDMCVSMGMSAEYGQTLVDFIFSPMAFVCAATTIAGALLGGFLGSKVFAKHFSKMGS